MVDVRPAAGDAAIVQHPRAPSEQRVKTAGEFLFAYGAALPRPRGLWLVGHGQDEPAQTRMSGADAVLATWRRAAGTHDALRRPPCRPESPAPRVSPDNSGIVRVGPGGDSMVLHNAGRPVCHPVCRRGRGRDHVGHVGLGGPLEAGDALDLLVRPVVQRCLPCCQSRAASAARACIAQPHPSERRRHGGCGHDESIDQCPMTLNVRSQRDPPPQRASLAENQSRSGSALVHTSQSYGHPFIHLLELRRSAEAGLRPESWRSP